jgi:hypothetical protein
MTTSATIEHLDPEGLVRNPAFTQVVTVAGAMVAGLAHTDALVELEAAAVVPLDAPG